MARYAAAADGEVIDVEYRQRQKDGSYRRVSGQHVIFSRHEDGRPRQILGVAQDVTERRRLPP
jgi:PAS domain-containing protein